MQIEKSIDSVPGIRTRGRRIVGEDKTMFTELLGTEFSKVSDTDIDTTYDPRYEFSRGPTTAPSTVNTVNAELKKYFKDLLQNRINLR